MKGQAAKKRMMPTDNVHAIVARLPVSQQQTLDVETKVVIPVIKSESIRRSNTAPFG